MTKDSKRPATAVLLAAAAAMGQGNDFLPPGSYKKTRPNRYERPAQGSRERQRRRRRLKRRKEAEK